jgi:hypothetical protein
VAADLGGDGGREPAVGPEMGCDFRRRFAAGKAEGAIKGEETRRLLAADLGDEAARDGCRRPRM